MKEWPSAPVPAWLAEVSVESMQEAPFPLTDVLAGAVYYPASGFDGLLVKSLASRVHSFVHVDYGLTREQLTEEFLEHGFKGYRILGRRAVSEGELAPNGWQPLPLKPGHGDPPRAMRRGTPFCDWIVFERLAEFGDDHGPAGFSLVHLHADGPAAFDALHRSNGLAPSAVAIVQPGHGFGGNWTDFTNPSKNPGAPCSRQSGRGTRVAAPGGIGGRAHYREPCWPTHGVFCGFITEGQTNVAVWRRSAAHP